MKVQWQITDGVDWIRCKFSGGIYRIGTVEEGGDSVMAVAIPMHGDAASEDVWSIIAVIEQEPVDADVLSTTLRADACVAAMRLVENWGKEPPS